MIPRKPLPLHSSPSRLWIKCRPDRRRRSRVRSTRENRRFSKWKKVMDDFFHGQLEARRSERRVGREAREAREAREEDQSDGRQIDGKR